MQERCNRCSADLAHGANYCARCGALVTSESAQDYDHDALLGRVLLGRYRVQRLLGEGGMGRVYLAEQAMGQATRPVAIKALRKELVRDPKGSSRFQRESEIVIRLAHPNTIQFYDFAELEDGTPVIVMEYIEGRTLGEVLRAGPLSHERARMLLAQICGSLAEAHAHGFVHRDLKPHNVLLTSRAGHDDFVKVLDFGIALQQSDLEYDATRMTTQGTLIGTPPYMSPEQFQGQPVDARSDVYALGVMAYEMLAGQLPFEAKTPWQWAAAHVDQAPRPLCEHASAQGLPAHSHDAVMRALNKDPAQRPSDAGALLREYLGPDATTRDDIVLSLAPRAPSQPAPAQPALSTAVTQRGPRPRRRSGARWTLTAIVLTLLTAMALVVGMRHRAAMQPRVTAHDDADRASTVTDEAIESKRTRGARRHVGGERGGSNAADDELSALAAHADRLHAIGDPTETASADSAESIDALTSARGAFERGELGAAAASLATAARTPGVDAAAISALSARIAAAIEQRTNDLAATRNCAELSSLAEQLRSASIAAPIALGAALESCRNSKSSPTDAGPGPSSAELHSP